ncbi:GGDEF domain-containing protein [Mycolicibacterium sp. Y3]
MMALRSRLQQREILDGLVLREPVFRYAIAAFVLVFGVVGVLSLASTDGPQTPVARGVVLVVSLTTLPVAIATTRLHLGSVWWSQRARWQPAPTLFVAYADTGLTVILAFQNAAAALLGTALFAVVGAYAAHFLTAVPRLLHIAVSSIVIVAFGVRTVAAGDTDPLGGIGQTVVLLVAVNGTVLLHGQYTSEIRRAIARSHMVATTDPLTLLANRRAFDLRARRLIETSPHGVDVLLVDVDHLKMINDSHGHDHGDQVLRRVAAGIISTVGMLAVSARLGGDEFGIAVAVRPDRTKEQVADALRQLLSREGISVSIGSARAEGPTPTGESEEVLSHLLKTADERMYSGKRRQTRP